jgi:hypothetical protein
MLANADERVAENIPASSMGLKAEATPTAWNKI